MKGYFHSQSNILVLLRAARLFRERGLPARNAMRPGEPRACFGSAGCQPATQCDQANHAPPGR